MMQNWFKYTWVCTSDCDALIEYTMKAGYTPNNNEINCLCGSTATLLSVVNATIDTPDKKEEQNMETTTTPAQTMKLDWV
jgi:hypothetical protein